MCFYGAFLWSDIPKMDGINATYSESSALLAALIEIINDSQPEFCHLQLETLDKSCKLPAPVSHL